MPGIDVAHNLQRVPQWEDIVADFHTGDVPSQSMGPIIRAVADLNDPSQHARIRLADIGCLTGRNIRDLATSRELDVHAVDLPGPQFAEFREEIAQDHLAITAHEITRGGDLPFDDESLDAVMILRVLHLLTDPRERMELLSKCWRTLVPGGILVASVRSRAAIDEGDFLEAEEDRRSGNILARRDHADVTRLYYSLRGLLRHDAVGFRRSELLRHGRIVDAELLPDLCMGLNDEWEMRTVDGESQCFWSPCIQVGFQKAQ